MLIFVTYFTWTYFAYIYFNTSLLYINFINSWIHHDFINIKQRNIFWKFHLSKYEFGCNWVKLIFKTWLKCTSCIKNKCHDYHYEILYLWIGEDLLKKVPVKFTLTLNFKIRFCFTYDIFYLSRGLNFSKKSRVETQSFSSKIIFKSHQN